MAQSKVAPIIRLKCGKKGADSTVAKFGAVSEGEDYSISPDKPYAELWMGTHPSLPSQDFTTGKSLLEILEEGKNASQMLSPEIYQEYGKKLPFLFKVLSVNQALSIQAHPNKKLAGELHKRDPKNYPDDNHKPEMAIALTKFEGLCGFRPLAEIRHFLKSVAPLRALVGEEAASEFEKNVRTGNSKEGEENSELNKKLLKDAFASMMESSGDQIEKAAAELIDQIKNNRIDLSNPESSDRSTTGQDMADLVLRLNEQYPKDIGLFNLFFLNYVKMEPGEAMFLQADDIHAYLSGDIIECMASSDNVVRAGFTPKFKDVSTLTSMLTYNYAPISEQKMTPSAWPYGTLNAPAYSSNSSILLYNPPIPEFAVIRTVLAATAKQGRGMATAKLAPLDGPSILICTSGSGAIQSEWKVPDTDTVIPLTFEVKTGYVYFVAAGTECTFNRLPENGGDDFVVYQAVCVKDLSDGNAVEASL